MLAPGVLSVALILGLMFVGFNYLSNSAAENKAADEAREAARPVETQPAQTTTVPDARRADWPTAVPSLHQLPFGALNPPAFAFSAPGSAADVAQLYLDDRFPDRGSLRISAEEVEILNGYGLFRWGWQDNTQSRTGWLYLRDTGGDSDQWSIVAATTDGVDLSRIRRTSQGFAGTAATGYNSDLFADIILTETGQLYDSERSGLADRVGLQPLGLAGSSPVGEQVATRLQLGAGVPPGPASTLVREVVGKTLSVSEVVLERTYGRPEVVIYTLPESASGVAVALEADPTIADYRYNGPADTTLGYENVFSNNPGIRDVWEANPGLVSIEVVIVGDGPGAEVPPSLSSAPGVLAASIIGEDDIRAFDPAELIAGVEEVESFPAVAGCESAPGWRTAPPAQSGTVAEPVLGSSSQDALLNFLDSSPVGIPYDSGFVHYQLPDGGTAFGFSYLEHRNLMLVKLLQSDEGWSVTEWALSGC